MPTIVVAYPPKPIVAPGGGQGVRVLPLGPVSDAAGRELRLPQWQFSSMFADDLTRVQALLILVGHDPSKGRIYETTGLPTDAIILGVIIRDGNLGQLDFPRVLAVSPSEERAYLLRWDDLIAEAKGPASDPARANPAHAVSALSYVIGVLTTPAAVTARVTYPAGDGVKLIECVEPWGEDRERTVAFATPDEIDKCESR